MHAAVALFIGSPTWNHSILILVFIIFCPHVVVLPYSFWCLQFWCQNPDSWSNIVCIVGAVQMRNMLRLSPYMIKGRTKRSQRILNMQSSTFLWDLWVLFNLLSGKSEIQNYQWIHIYDNQSIPFRYRSIVRQTVTIQKCQTTNQTNFHHCNSMKTLRKKITHTQKTKLQKPHKQQNPKASKYFNRKSTWCFIHCPMWLPILSTSILKSLIFIH